jgi:hypothetical protein
MSATASFDSQKKSLKELLEKCASGKMQLPDFQRSWVWDDEGIRSLLASISQGFPVGALMTLAWGGDVRFAPRLIQGAPDAAAKATPEALLLDGQQRMTSLYQTTMRQEVVRTTNAKRQAINRWYYIDMRKALDPEVDREEAIFGVPENRIVTENFGKDVVLDLSTPEQEYELMMFPLNQAFDDSKWEHGFISYWLARNDQDKWHFYKRFEKQVIDSFGHYHVPVIELAKETPKEAVCLVFEKVNTGGKKLDAFELLTAIYAADGFRLRQDWLGEGSQVGRYARLVSNHPLLKNLASTEFLQALSLLHTKAVRDAVAAGNSAAGKSGDLPAVSCTRTALLNLPLQAYKAYADQVEEGYEKAAKFLRTQRVYWVRDIPYQTQLIPLAAILAVIGDLWDQAEARAKITRWYWSGVFGELYGSATESRFAKDFVEVPEWLRGGEEPSTIKDSTFRADRLLTMRSRLSAAYKGINALLMRTGARDFRSGQDFDHTVAMREPFDIHHIFPKKWCLAKGIDWKVFDSIVNKTPLTAKTNKIIGGNAPSHYLARLTGSINAATLDECLRTHGIPAAELRADNFDAFFAARKEALIGLIEGAMGQKVYRDVVEAEPEEEVVAEQEEIVARQIEESTEEEQEMQEAAE